MRANNHDIGQGLRIRNSHSSTNITVNIPISIIIGAAIGATVVTVVNPAVNIATNMAVNVEVNTAVHIISAEVDVAICLLLGAVVGVGRSYINCEKHVFLPKGFLSRQLGAASQKYVLYVWQTDRY